MRLAGKQVTTPPPPIFPPPPGPWAGAHAKLHLMLYVQAIHTAIPMYSNTCSCCVCAFSWSFVDPVEGILLRVLLLILPLAAGGWGLKCPGLEDTFQHCHGLSYCFTSWHFVYGLCSLARHQGCQQRPSCSSLAQVRRTALGCIRMAVNAGGECMVCTCTT